jgi:hypothetical protein
MCKSQPNREWVGAPGHTGTNKDTKSAVPQRSHQFVVLKLFRTRLQLRRDVDTTRNPEERVYSSGQEKQRRLDAYNAPPKKNRDSQKRTYRPVCVASNRPARMDMLSLSDYC